MTDLHNDAVEFLALLRPGGPWVLTAIEPDGKIKTITAKTGDDVRAFVSKYNGTCNLYYSVNPTRKAMTSKAAKTDIAAIEYLLADLDPKQDETSEAAKVRYLALLDELKPAPTAIINSGNGIQVLLKLAEPIMLAEPVIATNAKGKSEKVFPAETAALITDVENRVKTLMEALGSVAGTQNIDRILRLPGTINLAEREEITRRTHGMSNQADQVQWRNVQAGGFPGCRGRAPLGNNGTSTNAAGSGNTKSKKGRRGSGSTSSSSTGTTQNQSTSLDWSKVDQHAGWLTTSTICQRISI